MRRYVWIFVCLLLNHDLTTEPISMKFSTQVNYVLIKLWDTFFYGKNLNKGYLIIKYVTGYKSLYENVVYYESMKTKECQQDKLVVTTARKYRGWQD